MNYYERALTLKDETIAHRRFLHTNAEVGLNMPLARAYVMEKLTEYGLSPQICGHGVTATIGTGGKVLLLRADMDALPMSEKSDEPFTCPAKKAAHTCGHDFHAAMLLTAAKMLKENEAALKGTVKLMFQPAEETLEGCMDMINAGILENPKVDAALAYHVAAGQMPMGLFMYNNSSTMMFAVSSFRITIQGKGAHGAYPHKAIDPINIGIHIYLGLKELIAGECDPTHSCALTIGHFEAGTTTNIIPDTAVLEGTLRTDNKDSLALLNRRLKEISEKTAAVYGGCVSVEMLSHVPPLICDQTLTNEIVSYMKELPIPALTESPGISSSASEDFALIAEKVPSTYMYLSAGFLDERGKYGAHHPKVCFNEEVCPIGASFLAHCATQWLENQK